MNKLCTITSLNIATYFPLLVILDRSLSLNVFAELAKFSEKYYILEEY